MGVLSLGFATYQHRVFVLRDALFCVKIVKPESSLSASKGCKQAKHVIDQPAPPGGWTWNETLYKPGLFLKIAGPLQGNLQMTGYSQL